MAKISNEIDGPTGLPLLRKRSGESRPLSIDIGGRLPSGSTIDGITSLAASKLGRISTANNLTLASQSYSGTVVEFIASGGTTGESYRVTATVTSGNAIAIGIIVVAVET